MSRIQQWFTTVAVACLLVTILTVRAQSSDRSEVSVTFTLSKDNNIVIQAMLNKTDKVNLMLHTAARGVTLTEEGARKSRSVVFTKSTKVQSWGGEADSRFSPGNRVQLGDWIRQNITIWENKHSGTDTDGKFGLDLFQDKIVEIDFDRNCLVLHKKLPEKASKYDRLNMVIQDRQLLVEGSCVIEGKTYSHQFLLHSGYSGGILLDDAFAARVGVEGKIKITNESSLKDSFGHTIKIKKGIMPVFLLGSSKMNDVPAGFFASAIGNQKMSVLGCEVIKQFNLIFDLVRHELYLVRRAG